MKIQGGYVSCCVGLTWNGFTVKWRPDLRSTASWTWGEMFIFCNCS